MDIFHTLNTFWVHVHVHYNDWEHILKKKKTPEILLQHYRFWLVLVILILVQHGLLFFYKGNGLLNAYCNYKLNYIFHTSKTMSLTVQVPKRDISELFLWNMQSPIIKVLIYPFRCPMLTIRYWVVVSHPCLQR